MTRTTQTLFKKALKLPVEARADLVELLLNSILEEESASRQKIDAAWAQEARDRFDAYLNGDIQAYPMEDVLKKLKKRHSA